MVASGTVLCSLEKNYFRGPRLRLEARKRFPGFEIWFEDEHLSPGGEIIARSYRPYSARRLAQMMRVHVAPRVLDLLIRYATLPDPRDGLVVTGERGLKAYMVRTALVADNLQWLDEQSDASFQFLESLADDEPGAYCVGFSDIASYAGVLNYDKDMLTLLRRFKLPAIGASLKALYFALAREESERKAELEARLAPFRAEIEAIAGQFSDVPRRGSGTTFPSERVRMRVFLEDYVREYGRMPRGKRLLNYHARHWPHMGPKPIDFDALSEQIRAAVSS
ncbi:MAG: hypothetical protein C5B56_15440 [Proteobacteria bacterium]|nr:MAG: hypothetical protein C5B56_15440 [Pseudomonadota bacterium]